MAPRQDDRPELWHRWIERIYERKEFYVPPGDRDSRDDDRRNHSQRDDRRDERQYRHEEPQFELQRGERMRRPSAERNVGGGAFEAFGDSEFDSLNSGDTFDPFAGMSGGGSGGSSGRTASANADPFASGDPFAGSSAKSGGGVADPFDTDPFAAAATAPTPAPAPAANASDDFFQSFTSAPAPAPAPSAPGAVARRNAIALSDTIKCTANVFRNVCCCLWWCRWTLRRFGCSTFANAAAGSGSGNAEVDLFGPPAPAPAPGAHPTSLPVPQRTTQLHVGCKPVSRLCPRLPWQAPRSRTHRKLAS